MNDRVSETANGDPDESSRLLSLPEAAEWLNVHYMTAYRWVRRGDLPAFKTGGRLRVRQAALEHFLADRQLDLAVGDRPATATNWQRHRERLIASLLAGDATQARSEVRKVISDGATAGDVYIHLLTPALHDIGRRWADGNIGVGEEHRASQICVTIIAQLGGLFRRRGPVRDTAVALTPPDDSTRSHRRCWPTSSGRAVTRCITSAPGSPPPISRCFSGWSPPTSSASRSPIDWPPTSTRRCGGHRPARARRPPRTRVSTAASDHPTRRAVRSEVCLRARSATLSVCVAGQRRRSTTHARWDEPCSESQY